MKLNVGGVIYDVGNSIKNKTGTWRNFKPIITKKCNRCGICVKSCPEGCIKIKGRVIIDYDYCKGCLICSKECPLKAIIIEKEKK